MDYSCASARLPTCLKATGWGLFRAEMFCNKRKSHAAAVLRCLGGPLQFQVYLAGIIGECIKNPVLAPRTRARFGL
ncbi:hypothetical protein Z948_573 [Sulfitobacter donghicola DSW-25 = KCTC 12864 = JCM 14565]|uniref:Uncharacterized protein n=1 Tax=Sulfitobacter donghicola DSW-25 = KCTC 12864 = JCM 14565 TaxID=1300350 RepID=A0A073IJ10_9RHOB|nr:hypothetical protein DSW25_07250 [Sulfitobacter donghicola DSW-25 = KCTC 12864 = JCM 14565]KIN66869.1 hypothetical protein Z948_573 [Sulfitobacter donghicola DSW-25 = KCTC 12864 = JCM 14565]